MYNEDILVVELVLMRAPGVALLLAMALGLGGCTKGPATTPAPAPVTTPAQAPEPSAPAKGGTYKGTVARGYGISFKLSPDGKQITELHADVLESCTGSSTSRTTTLYFEGPFVASADGSFAVAGEEKEYGTEYRFSALLTPDGKASGRIFQAGAGCTTFELQWEAERQ